MTLFGRIVKAMSGGHRHLLTAQRVRIRILHAGQVVHDRVIEDDYYAAVRDPSHDGVPARQAMAAQELREWLTLTDPAPGEYSIHVSEVLDDDTAGQVWAAVKVGHVNAADRSTL